MPAPAYLRFPAPKPGFGIPVAAACPFTQKEGGDGCATQGKAHLVAGTTGFSQCVVTGLPHCGVGFRGRPRKLDRNDMRLWAAGISSLLILARAAVRKASMCQLPRVAEIQAWVNEVISNYRTDDRTSKDGDTGRTDVV
ncbi:unnamed protein product [Notodromas monacha]|uniref:Uncharacterized protein n=1 Tax=Notodromas monacha TaxID=399045 RepID=A0A7R9BHI9_9CRUS|nr:unnamed protein product [Notodromas monacha]CAG0914193.1 unnamed protein product [Notodromas monacha]